MHEHFRPTSREKTSLLLTKASELSHVQTNNIFTDKSLLGVYFQLDDKYNSNIDGVIPGILLLLYLIENLFLRFAPAETFIGLPRSVNKDTFGAYTAVKSVSLIHNNGKQVTRFGCQLFSP